MLYIQIKNESDKGPNSKCTCGLIILFIAFTIAIVTDFFLPLIFDYNSDEDYYNNDPIYSIKTKVLQRMSLLEF